MHCPVSLPGWQRERNLVLEEVYMLRKLAGLIIIATVASLSTPAIAGVTAPEWGK